MAPLHFGDYGGLPMKIIWVLLDLVSIAILGSGFYLGRLRRSSAARQAEHHSLMLL
ncbi:PepSY domain-containing protein [Afipia sp. Root123D2]|uniref:PepSY domain-containing protein n=1 Tax=Afipia sp. Root123D2 TaxID=1736436 RepID=UPI0009EB20D1|nr:PepSY domain-containing protein [Afipia sp. Root123D2]